MLQEAGRLAFNARDYELALDVVDALADRFDVDPLALRTKILAAENADPESSSADRYSLGLELMKEAVVKGRLDAAITFEAIAQKAADESKNPTLVTYLKGCKTRLEDEVRRKNMEAGLLARLSKSPDDSAANLELGRFYCFDRGDWEKGLSMLALGSDAALKKVAKKSWKSRPTVKAQLELQTHGGNWHRMARLPKEALC